jgi:hypothetical protein
MKPADKAKNKKPFRAGSCKCGVPNCPGHETRPDGRVHIPGHPKGHVVISPL